MKYVLWTIEEIGFGFILDETIVFGKSFAGSFLSVRIVSSVTLERVQH